MRARTRFAATFLSIALLSGSAAAQVSDTDRATARSLAQQGQDALEKKDFTAAADRFGRADAIVHAPTLLLGLARAQIGLGKLVAAQEAYNRILREGAPAGGPAAFARAVADARKELDALEPRLPSVVIHVKGPSSAKVTLDGVPVPSAALGVNRPADPGKHIVRAEAEGWSPAEATVTVAERKAETVTLTLTPGPASPAAPAPAPPSVASPASGPRSSSELTGVSTPDAPAQSSTQRMIGFAGIGIGAAGLVMGAITGGLALSKESSLSGTCPGGHCTGQQGDVDSFHLMANLSNVGFIGGGVLAVAGVVLVATAPRRDTPKHASVVPWIGPGFAGAKGCF